MEVINTGRLVSIESTGGLMTAPTTMPFWKMAVMHGLAGDVFHLLSTP